MPRSPDRVAEPGEAASRCEEAQPAPEIQTGHSQTGQTGQTTEPAAFHSGILWSLLLLRPLSVHYSRIVWVEVPGGDCEASGPEA